MKKLIRLFFLICIINVNLLSQEALNCKLVAVSDLAKVWCMAVKDNYVFTGMSYEFAVLNVADIYNTTLVYKDTLASHVESIYVENDLAYIGMSDGLLIMDIADIDSPKKIVKLGTEQYIVRVIVDNGLAYLGTQDYAFLIIDVHDPRHPLEVGRVDKNIDDVWGMDIKGDTLFVASEDIGLKIFDISDPSQPVEKANISLEPSATTVNVKIKDNIAYVLHPHDLYTFDISDLDNIKPLDYLKDGGGSSVFIDGDYAYIDAKVVNISDPANLEQAGSYPAGGGIDNFVRDNIIFVPAQNDGLYFIQFDEVATINDKIFEPERFILRQNYPNPFNPSTIINYQLSVNNFVKLVIYDALGRQVKILVNKKQSAGTYSVDFDASGLASGVYYCRLSAGNFRQTRKMLLLR